MFLRCIPRKYSTPFKLGVVTTTGVTMFSLPKHAFADHKGSDLRKMVEERNKEDNDVLIKEYQYNISRAYPYLAGKITDLAILTELDYIRVMYTQPLQTERKIILRSKILGMIESGKLSEEACDGLILLLKEYRAL